jgi:xylulokinase
MEESKSGVNAFTSLADQAAHSSVGARGLVLLPYFEGERTPLHDPHAKGMLFGLSLKHTRGDIYRAILEGVAYGIRHNLEAMNDENVVPDRVIAVGGGTKNPIWLQITADVCRIPLQVPTQQIGASYGDAFLAGQGIGLFKELREIKRWVKIRETVSPNDELSPQYDFYYHIFRDLYEHTKELMHKLSDHLLIHNKSDV